MSDVLTILAIAAFVFFGCAVTIVKDKILNGLRDGLKKRKEKQCCGGNCHCDEK